MIKLAGRGFIEQKLKKPSFYVLKKLGKCA